jgi:hypothetical protein
LSVSGRTQYACPSVAALEIHVSSRIEYARVWHDHSSKHRKTADGQNGLAGDDCDTWPVMRVFQ